MDDAATAFDGTTRGSNEYEAAVHDVPGKVALRHLAPVLWASGFKHRIKLPTGEWTVVPHTVADTNKVVRPFIAAVSHDDARRLALHILQKHRRLTPQAAAPFEWELDRSGQEDHRVPVEERRAYTAAACLTAQATWLASQLPRAVAEGNGRLHREVVATLTQSVLAAFDGTDGDDLHRIDAAADLLWKDLEEVKRAVLPPPAAESPATIKAPDRQRPADTEGASNALAA